MRTRVKFWLWCGLMFANLGLFLQPLSPSAFLLLAFTDPLATFGAHGLLAALLFWAGALLLAVSVLDAVFTRRAATAGGEFEDGWAFI